MRREGRGMKKRCLRWEEGIFVGYAISASRASFASGTAVIPMMSCPRRRYSSLSASVENCGPSMQTYMVHHQRPCHDFQWTRPVWRRSVLIEKRESESAIDSIKGGYVPEGWTEAPANLAESVRKARSWLSKGWSNCTCAAIPSPKKVNGRNPS